MIRYRNPGWYKRVKFLAGTHTIAVGTPGESLRFCDAASGKLTREMTFGDAYLQAFDVSPDDAFLATSCRGGDLKIRTVPEFDLVRTLHAPATTE